ncbi:MAG: extracellular solute-binding protein [Isosphaeraceae bacterium]|nr:extracellular solute-binding protein [Isosphaeraceae bacterium]
MSNRLVMVGAAIVALAVGAGVYWKFAHKRPEVVVYTALDREFSEPVLELYASKTGVDVLPKFDVESTKTVGLFNLLVFEGPSPRCDLFWNNEIVNTIRLKDKGLLAPFRPKNADDFPATFKAKDGTWYGFAARARILLVNTKLIPDEAQPASIEDLVDPKWKGKVGLAKPLFGTTATHAACLFTAWGDERAKAFFRKLRANGAQVFSGNRQVATAVGNGEIAFGLTDTDDALAELSEGRPVTIVYPDREPNQLGTLFIPNTLALIRGARHKESAEDLANFLLSPDAETALAQGPGGQIPLNPRVKAKTMVETPKTVHAMEVDFEAAARRWDETAAFLLREFGEE